uniref:Uncharacterized protein n=1 Tax=Arundo donax TaxID=35708 RepID=A0A0A8ZMH9_ARUDO
MLDLANPCHSLYYEHTLEFLYAPNSSTPEAFGAFHWGVLSS